MDCLAKLEPGFSDPVLDAQRVFRTILRAMSRPGIPIKLAGPRQTPALLSRAAAGLCLALLDMDTGLWTDLKPDNPDCLAYLAFHCGCPVEARRDRADFALITAPADLETWPGFNRGTAEFPEQSTSLIIQVEGFQTGRGVALSGPGIASPVKLEVKGLPDGFWPFFKTANQEFPLGLDAYLVSPDRVCALARTTQLELT